LLIESRSKQIEKILDKSAIDIIQDQPTKFARALFYLLETSGWKIPYYQMQNVINWLRRYDSYDTKNRWFDSANERKIELEECEYKSLKNILLTFTFDITGTKIKIKGEIYYKAIRSEGDLRQTINEVLDPIVSSINRMVNSIIKAENEGKSKWDVIHQNRPKEKNLFSPLIELAKKKNLNLRISKDGKITSFTIETTEFKDNRLTSGYLFTHQIREMKKLFPQIIQRENNSGNLLKSYNATDDSIWLSFISSNPDSEIGGNSFQKQVERSKSWKEYQDDLLSNVDNFFMKLFEQSEQNYYIVIKKLFKGMK